jgi:hypothetical protein
MINKNRPYTYIEYPPIYSVDQLQPKRPLKKPLKVTKGDSETEV